MSKRLTPYQAQAVRRWLEKSLSDEHFRHPDLISNYPEGIRITDRQKSYHLNVLVQQGRVERKQQWRGWYTWCSYRRVKSEQAESALPCTDEFKDIPF